MPTKLRVFRCRKCGSADVELVEMVKRYFRVLGSEADGRVNVENFWPPDISDEGTDQRISCRSCGYSFDIDPSAIEYVDDMNSIEEIDS
jgi:DNA-directed RNA polymerase subunit M/transcription elongation factor TFIIS